MSQSDQDFQKAKKRAAKLRQLIDHYRYEYHVHDKSLISDAAHDSLKHELYLLEQKYPGLITPDSPTQRIGGKPLKKFVKVKHKYPVLSLEDAFSFEELRDYQKKIGKKLTTTKLDYFAELKIDGLSIVLTYEDGIFVKGVTRGDGKYGEDVTSNLKTIDSIPLKLSGKKRTIPKELIVRGEVFMSKAVFRQINKDQEKKGLKAYANPRNTAAGSIRQLDPKIAASRNLDCFTYDILNNIGQRTHKDVHQWMSDWGFKISKYTKYCKDLSEVIKYIKSWEDKRKKLDYETDGVVVVVNNIKYQKELGSVGKADRWMIAYKFPAEQATTIVKDIKIQVGRTGTLTPVAFLKPVLVAGSTVSRATLHNEDEILRLDVRVGDTVVIQKAGDIIPDIVKVIKELRPKSAKPFHMPSKCPICGSKAIRHKGEAAHVCTNRNCFAKQRRSIFHFVSKSGFDIENLGPQIVDQLIEQDLIKTPADIFTLTRGDLEPLERFAEKSADNLIKSIEKSKNITLPKFINALGIRHVGVETANDLATHFKSLDRLIKASKEELNSIYEVGEVMADSVYSYFKDPNNLQLIQELQKNGVKVAQLKTNKNQPLKSESFVITGTLEKLSRDEAKSQIRALGGSTPSSVSKKTTYLVAGKNPGSKLQKAKKLGVTVLTEGKFLKLIS